MGKNSKPSAPTYTPSAYEQQLQNYVQQSMLSNLPNVNVFSDDVRRQLESQLHAYTNKGLNFINETYTPMFTDLKNDIARRFGNFDNAVFMNNLNSVESKRADSMNAFAQDIMAMQSKLYNEELARRYNYINVLNGLQTGMDNKALSYMGLMPTQQNYGTDYGALLQQLAMTGIKSINPLESLKFF